MANKFLIKRGDGAPNNAAIDNYELVYNYTNNELWTKHNGSVVKVASGATGTVTNVVAGNGLTGGGTVTATLDLDFSELTDMTGDISGTTEFILQNGTVESRKAASEIKLTAFDATGFSIAGTVDTSGSPSASEYARFTDSNTVQGISAAGVRTDLGLVIGTNVQAQNDYLQDIADLSTDNATQNGYVLAYNDAYPRFELVEQSGGVSFNGSTANGLLTYGNSTTADVEANLTFTPSNNYLTVHEAGTSTGSHLRLATDNSDFIFSASGANNHLTIYDVNATANSLVMDSAGKITLRDSLKIPVGKSVFFGGSEHTYIREDIDDRLRFFVGGAEMFRLNEINDFASFFTDVALAATDKLYLDGGGSTYITETAGDLVDMVVGGVTLMRFEESGTDSVFTNDNVQLGVGVHKDFVMYHDGSHNYMKLNNGNLYFRDQSNNNIFQIYREGGGIQLSEGDLKIPATSKIYLDGGSDTYIHEPSSNQIGFVTGGNTRLLILPHKTYINSTGANGLVMNNDEGATQNSGRIFFEGTSTSAIMQEVNDLSFRTGATTGSSSGTERFRVNTSGVDVVGNIAVSGTVDGRDVASDGSKLDGIESGATADQTITLTGDVTGSGTGSFATTIVDDSHNHSWINSNTGDPGDSRLQYWQAASNTTLNPNSNWFTAIRMGHGDPVTYYSNTIAVQMTGTGTGDLYTRNIANGTAGNWFKHWHDGNDGSGSGLDADLLDGLQGSSYWTKSGSWVGDLASNGYTRVQGVANGGGEFVLALKNSQLNTLIDGSYFAYEGNSAAGGGFWSSYNSSYANATGFKATGTSTIAVTQQDGGSANLEVTGTAKISGSGGYTLGNVADQIRIQTNGSDTFSFLNTGNGYATGNFQQIYTASFVQAGSGVQVWDATHGFTSVLLKDSTYTKLLNPQGNVSMYLGDTGDGNNYYQAGEHRFRNYAGSAYFARIGSGYIRGEGGGTEGTPQFSFQNDTNTGMYSLGADDLGFSAGGSLKYGILNGLNRFYSNVVVGPNNNNSKPYIQYKDGYDTASTPSYSWYYDNGCGMGHPAGSTIAFSTGSNERLRINNSGLSVSGDITINGNTTAQAGHFFSAHNESRYDKYRMYAGSSAYAIGMYSGNAFGGLNDWAMTFTFNDEADRGFLWRDTAHSQGQGAMSLTTNGKLAVAHSVRLGYGETDNTTPGATYRLDVSGSIGATADVVAYISSDKRLKDNIKNIANPLDKLNKLNGVEFDWNDKQDLYKGHDIGVIAQEVEEVLPEIVDTREDGHKAVKYDRMVALLIEAVKEQQQQINELQEKLDG